MSGQRACTSAPLCRVASFDNVAPLTDDALPAIVAGLRARGYALVTVSDLLSG